MDSAGDLTEDCMAAGVPAPERVTLFDLHRIIGTGLFNFKKSVGDSDCTTASLPFIIITYTDRTSWSFGGSDVRLLRFGDHSTMTTSELLLRPLRLCENNCSCKSEGWEL